MGEPDIGNYVIMLQGMKRTGGSETSQYPEEKKSTEISQVAASEREGAPKVSCVLAESRGKVKRRG